MGTIGGPARWLVFFFFKLFSNLFQASISKLRTMYNINYELPNLFHIIKLRKKWIQML